MMKKIYVREIRHIIANHALTGKATGYRMNSKSIVTKVIRVMIKNKWVECKNIDGQFMFVSPSKKITAVFCPYVTGGEIRVIPVINKNFAWNPGEKDFYGRSPEIAMT